MPRFIFTVVLTLAGTDFLAHAEHINDKDSPCSNVVITVDLVNCFAAAWKKADAKLNAVYQHLQQTLDADD